MNELVLPPSPTIETISPRPPAVYADGRARPDLHVVSWTLEPAPRFGQATLAWSGPGTAGGWIEQVGALPPVGSRLQICPAGGAASFDGVISSVGVRVGPEGDELLIEARDWLAVRLGQCLRGRWQLSGQTAVLVPDGVADFNAPAGLASAEPALVNGRWCRVFDASPAARPWALDEILNYLLAAHAPADVAFPEPDELAARCGQLAPLHLSTQGLSLAEILAKAAERAGLAWRGTSAGVVDPRRGLALYRPGRDGPLRPLGLQAPGGRLDGRRSNLWRGQLQLGAGSRAVRLLGRRKCYETTLELGKGWDASLETACHADFVRGGNANFPARADVFRTWILNEDGAYSGPPWNLPPADLSSISADDFLLAAPRRLLPCLSRDPAGRSLGVVIEVSLDAGATWAAYGGALEILPDCCGVRVRDDALPADYFQAALFGQLRLRVTAVIESDRHLCAQRDGAAGQDELVLNVPSAGWAKVHPSSVFYQAPDLPPAEMDDQAGLEALADRLAPASSAHGRLTLGWLDTSWQVGDRIGSIHGRELSLTGGDGVCPSVQSVEHRLGDEWTTHLLVTA